MMLIPSTTFMFKKANMLSADGRCKALDQAAEGYVRSEVRPNCMQIADKQSVILCFDGNFSTLTVATPLSGITVSDVAVRSCPPRRPVL